MTVKFIPHTDESRSAADAATLSSLDFGYALYLQTKKVSFKLGNINSAGDQTYTVTISGLNSTLVADTLLSEDDTTYTSSIDVTVPSGEISPVLYARHIVREGAVANSGLVRIHVVES